MGAPTGTATTRSARSPGAAAALAGVALLAMLYLFFLYQLYNDPGLRELGFGLVSDGTGTPYRVRCRGPCFANLAVLGELVLGMMIPDIVPTFGTVNMIAGECDR